jgi:alanine racemase
MKEWLKRMVSRHRTNTPLILVNIRKDRLLSNIRTYQKIAGVPVSPVLKSNAYGHGLIETARVIEKAALSGKIQPIPFLIIDSYFEATALRARGITTPLLVIGYTPAKTISTNKLRNVTFTITSIDALRELSNAKTTIHLKIDTGMYRQGILPEEIREAKEIISKSQISLTGVCSHLASSDRDDQIEVWEELVNQFPDVTWRHISATDGHNIGVIGGVTMTRLGIGMYLGRDGLNPALEMTTTVSGIKRVKTGERIGYDGTFTVKDDMIIATIPVGYFEGLDRRLSNKGFVKINDILAPIVGRVSMNISTVDITNIPDVTLGTKVIVISAEPNDKNSIKNIASICDTITHEILVHIPEHLKRITI